MFRSGTGCSLPGDQIRVGNSVLIFQERSSGSSATNCPLQLDATPVPGAATVVLRKEDALYLQTPRPENLPATAKNRSRPQSPAGLQPDALNSVERLGSSAGKDPGGRSGHRPGGSGRHSADGRGNSGLFVDSLAAIDSQGANPKIHASQTISEPRARGAPRDPIE